MAMVTNQTGQNSVRAGGLSVGRVAWAGFTGWQGISTYQYRREENPDESKAVSFGYAALDTALWEFAPWIAAAKDIGYEGAKAIGESGIFDKKLMESRLKSKYGNFASWKYEDTEQNYTMRQRATQMMASSRQNLRSALGNEARSLHRGAF